MGPGTAIAIPVLGTASFLPVFNSGLRRERNFWQWIWGHTVFGPFPLYVPKELALGEEGANMIIAQGKDIQEIPAYESLIAEGAKGEVQVRLAEDISNEKLAALNLIFKDAPGNIGPAKKSPLKKTITIPFVKGIPPLWAIMVGLAVLAIPAIGFLIMIGMMPSLGRIALALAALGGTGLLVYSAVKYETAKAKA